MKLVKTQRETSFGLLLFSTASISTRTLADGQLQVQSLVQSRAKAVQRSRGLGFQR